MSVYGGGGGGGAQERAEEAEDTYLLRCKSFTVSAKCTLSMRWRREVEEAGVRGKW